jgi:hypothetical protein
MPQCLQRKRRGRRKGIQILPWPRRPRRRQSKWVQKGVRGVQGGSSESAIRRIRLEPLFFYCSPFHSPHFNAGLPRATNWDFHPKDLRMNNLGQLHRFKRSEKAAESGKSYCRPGTRSLSKWMLAILEWKLDWLLLFMRFINR